LVSRSPLHLGGTNVAFQRFRPVTPLQTDQAMIFPDLSVTNEILIGSLLGLRSVRVAGLQDAIIAVPG